MRVAKACIVCGTVSLIKRSHADKEGTYCSRSCMAVDYRARMSAASNPNWRHGEAGTTEWRKRKNKEWRDRNPETMAACNRNLKASRRKAIGKHSRKDERSALRRQRGLCAICSSNLKNGKHLDHIIPIFRGGTNYAGNIQFLCQKCNLEKGSLLPIEFRARRASRIVQVGLSRETSNPTANTNVRSPERRQTFITSRRVDES